MFKGAEAELAGEHYQRAIDLKDTDAEFYYRLARLYFAMHRSQESQRYTQLSIKHYRLVSICAWDSTHSPVTRPDTVQAAIRERRELHKRLILPASWAEKR